MQDLEKLYRRLPISVQHLACSLEGWRVGQARYGREFDELLSAYKRRTYWSRAETSDFRDRRLQKWMHDCVRRVPFYQSRLRQAGIAPEDIRTFDDLKNLPILIKEDVQLNSKEILSQAVPESERITVHTSGTTGGGLEFRTTRRAMHEQWAVWWRYRGWHGIDRNAWCGYFAGRSVVPISQTEAPFWRFNHPGRQILFSGYHMSPRVLSAYVDVLRRRKPPWLHGYPSLLSLLASWLVERGFDLGYQPRWVTVGAENLLPQQVEVMQRAFGVRPRQHYGMAEAVGNISECELGALHVDEDFSAVEFVPSPYGEGYRVIGSNFTNYATPLLRYDVHDLVAMDERSCSCGRPGRIVAAVDGRLEDYIILTGGARLGRLDHIFKHLVHIREAQIFQNRPGAITIRVVRGESYSQPDELELLSEARTRVGRDCEIEIVYVDGLQRSQTGKLRFVMSEIAHEHIAQAGATSSGALTASTESGAR
jgi:phenylacetate-CoA ligase